MIDQYQEMSKFILHVKYFKHVLPSYTSKMNC